MAKTVLFALAFLLIFLMQIVIMPSPAMAQTSAISSTTSQKTQSFIVSDGFIAYIDLTKPDMRSSYDIDFIPPDGISKLLSVEIIVKGDFPPSSLVTILLNGQPCNPREWRVPESDKKYIENYEAVFECVDNAKELIGRKWTVDFSTNAVASNVRLTYKNKYFNDWNLPSIIEKGLKKPALSMFGTEYSVGDIGTIFLQLKDVNGIPVVNGSCYLNIFYPNSGNLSHPQWIFNSPMIYKSGSDGLFYYDLTMPNLTGIYMLSGSCSYDYAPIFIYPADSLNTSTLEAVKGTYEGDTIALNSKEDGLYTRCTSAASPVPQQCIANYTYTLYDSINADNITKIDIYYMGESTVTPTMRMSIYNYSSGTFYLLPNSLIFNGLASASAPSGLNDFLSNSISSFNMSDFIGNKKITIKLNTTGSTSFKNWNNWLTLRILTDSGIIVDVKGSGELHVTNISNSISVSTASAVWNYPNRTLTDYNQTKMWEYLNQINTTTSAFSPLLAAMNSSLYAYIFQVNNSIYTRINEVNNSLSNSINNVNDNLNSVNSSLYNLILSINTSVTGNFTVIEDYILSVNQTQNEHFSSLFNLIQSVNSSLSNQISDVNISLINELSSIGSQLSDIYDINLQINETVAKLNVSVNMTALESLILAVNQSLYSKIEESEYITYAINASIMNKLYALQSELAAVNTSIYNRFGETDNLILSVNSSLANQLYGIKSDVLTTYNEVVNVYEQLNLTNQTIMNKLYSMQSELADIYTINLQINETVSNLPSAIANLTINLTPVLDFLILMNHSMTIEFNDTRAATFAINESIMNKLYLIQGDLSNIYALSVSINGTVELISINLLTVNQSITDAIYQMNSSITNELYGIRDQLQNVTGDLAQVMLLIGDVNESLTDQLYQIQNGVNDLSSLINLTNQTIMTKLYKIQDEITSVNDTVKSSNLTIMGKLDIITSDIYAINASIITYLLLISNVTVNITLSQQALFNDMVAMWGDSITPKVYSAGFTGFLPSAYAQEEGQYVCLNNQTLRKTVNITLDTPDGLRDYVRTIDTQCTYGCKNNTCVQPDYMLYILLLIAVIAMYVIYRHWFADRGMT